MADAAQILILDDEPNICVTLSRALELEGYRALAARSVTEAQGLLRTARPDLGLFDVKLPDGDGIELLQSLRGEGRDLPVIVMSGHGSIDDAVRAIQVGATDYLEKPIGQDRLLVTVKNALRMDRLARENRVLWDEAEEARGEVEILGRSKAVRELKAQIERVAQSEGRVLITGENGTGKELVARAIHAASRRAQRPFVSLNCAAVPRELIESELFGHERGAFTGAAQRKIGKFERADEGTLFLDEVGDMPADMQVKLLRVLQTGELERVGGLQTLTVDVRVIAATNKNLEAEIAEGRFREDLYYRLNVVPIESPPLRARKEDLPLLVERFLSTAAAKNHCSPPELAPSALAVLADHTYPGNVRELLNLVERMVILAPRDKPRLEAEDIQPFMPGHRRSAPAVYREGASLSELVREAERRIVVEALTAHGDRVADTARALGVERSNFHKKLKALGLR